MQAERWLVDVTAIVVLIAWIVALGIAVFREEYTALTITTPVMLLLSGYTFGMRMARKNGAS